MAKTDVSESERLAITTNPGLVECIGLPLEEFNWASCIKSGVIKVKNGSNDAGYYQVFKTKEMSGRNMLVYVRRSGLTLAVALEEGGAPATSKECSDAPRSPLSPGKRAPRSPTRPWASATPTRAASGWHRVVRKSKASITADPGWQSYIVNIRMDFDKCIDGRNADGQNYRFMLHCGPQGLDYKVAQTMNTTSSSQGVGLKAVSSGGRQHQPKINTTSLSTKACSVSNAVRGQMMAASRRTKALQ